MKKLVSAVLAAALSIAAMAPSASFAVKYGDGDDIVIFGDSISSGYGLSDKEYNYGQLMADYIGGSVENYAVTGDTTEETIALLKSMSADQKAKLKDAEYVVISTGTNDMIEYASTYMLKVCADVGCLKNGYTAENIPAKPGLSDAMELVDKEALKAYIANFSNALKLNTEIAKLRVHLTATEGTDNYQNYDRVIETKIIPNLKTIVAEVKAVNPDAEIVVQTMYNPLQFEDSYYDATFQGSYRNVMNALIPVFAAASESYRSQMEGIDGIKTADVLATFSSAEKVNEKEVNYGWYFTKIQNGLADLDVHPTQAGHVAIASTVLNTIGKNTESGSLLRTTFDGLPKKDSYPAYALAEFRKVVPERAAAADVKLGDINDDGAVDSKDASLALAEYAAAATGAASVITADGARKAADINGDTAIDSKDASLILAFYSDVSTGSKFTDMREWLKTQ